MTARIHRVLLSYMQDTFGKSLRDPVTERGVNVLTPDEKSSLFHKMRESKANTLKCRDYVF